MTLEEKQTLSDGVMRTRQAAFNLSNLILRQSTLATAESVSTHFLVHVDVRVAYKPPSCSLCGRVVGAVAV